MTSPAELESELPLSAGLAMTVAAGRATVLSILAGQDPRLLAIVGPCSLFDPGASLEYGERLARLAERVEGSLVVVMRAYPEKSRTGLGWRGLAEEPSPGSGRDPESGIRASRGLLVQLANMGLPLAAEVVSPFLWRYWDDCLAWAAVGARGVESQALRELGSILPVPLAFKNGLDGTLVSSLNAALVASKPTILASIDPEGRLAAIGGEGNPLPHLCLRGGGTGEPRPNWSLVPEAAHAMRSVGLLPAVLVDAGHDNREPRGPARLLDDIVARRRGGLPGWESLRGFMVESFLEAGRQDPGPLSTLRRGLSITDECLGWDETERLLLGIAEAVG